MHHTGGSFKKGICCVLVKTVLTMSGCLIWTMQGTGDGTRLREEEQKAEGKIWELSTLTSAEKQSHDESKSREEGKD